MDSGLKRRACDEPDPEAERIWGALTRVAAITETALEDACVHTGTLKLDGRRVALACRRGIGSRIDARGRRVLDRDLPCCDFVLDAEEHGGCYWVFDALFIGTLDVRPLSLADRLSCARAFLRTPLSLGGAPVLPKEYLPLRSTDDVKTLLRALEESEQCDGLIFCDLTAPYEIPALKFKPELTVDFCLESDAHGPPGAYRLLTQVAGQLKTFVFQGKPARLVVTAKEALRLNLPLEGHLDREAACIVECSIPRGSRGRWCPLRRRDDRRSPNCLKTVLDTLALSRRGLERTSFLHHSLRSLDAKAAVATWRSVLRRRFLALGEALDTTCVLDVCGIGRPHPPGLKWSHEKSRQVALDKLPASLPDAGFVFLLACFELTDEEILKLIDAVSAWLQGSARTRHARVLFALQTAQGCASPEDARYFGVVNELGLEALRARAAELLGAAVSSRFPEDDLPAPLELADLGASLLRGMCLVEASDEETPPEIFSERMPFRFRGI
jgi:hypothetical protein